MDFEMNFENKMIYDAYCSKDNYCYKDFNSNSRRCLIFFASNALYYPDEEAEFRKKIIQADHYEGMNISKNIRIKEYFGRIIWVRDLYKSWYVAGISSYYNSVDKVCELLESITKGYEVYTAGASAGGYMAVIAGIKLKAKAVYNLSGQYTFFLCGAQKRELVQFYKNNKERNRYYDIADMTLSDVPILYFYPGGSEEDRKQAAYVHERNEKNIYYFCIKRNQHGNPVFGRNLIYILTMDHKKLIESAKWGKRIGRYRLFAKTAGILPCIRGLFEEKAMRTMHFMKRKIVK